MKRNILLRISQEFTRAREKCLAYLSAPVISDRDFCNRLGISPQEKTAYINETRTALSNNNLAPFSVLTRGRGEWEKIITCEERAALESEAQAFKDHRFSLLGSGPVKIDYNLDAAGFEGYRYAMKPKEEKRDLQRKAIKSLADSLKIACDIDSYEPIDWHRDFKSGYRWADNVPFVAIRYGDTPGADVVMPWELSRFYHAVRLGQAYRVTRDESYAREIILEILDWIAANRFKFGVNWYCSMDIAFRASNWTVALGLIHDSPLLSDDFLFFVMKSIFRHSSFIRTHLERQGAATANHYISDLAGLFFTNTVFPRLPQAAAYRDFAQKELESEIIRQVCTDGGDFERSSAYHWLVSTIFLYCAMLGRKQGRGFSDPYLRRLRDMFSMLRAVFCSHGFLPRYGDNDSGRFIVFEMPRRNDLRRDFVLPLAEWFFGDEKGCFAADADTSPLAWLSEKPSRPQPVVAAWRTRPSSIFRESGVAALRNDSVEVVCVLAPEAQTWPTAHSHNDFLSCEIAFEGKSFVVDNGSYVYTPLPRLRNLFRSRASHNVIVIPDAPMDAWPEGQKGVFIGFNNGRTKVIHYEPQQLIAEHACGDYVYRRELRIEEAALRARDSVQCPGKTLGGAYIAWHLHPAVDVETIDERTIRLRRSGSRYRLGIDNAVLRKEKDFYSPEYGRKEPSWVIIAALVDTHASWSILKEN
jgi:hypothetical protein